MLTKTDLKQISGIVQKELGPVRSDTNQLRQDTTQLKKDTTQLRKTVNSGFKKLERKLDYTINFLDREYLKLKERVERIEDHLGISTAAL